MATFGTVSYTHLDVYKRQEYEVALTDEEKSAIQEATKKFDEGNGLEAKELVSGETEYVLSLIHIYISGCKEVSGILRERSHCGAESTSCKTADLYEFERRERWGNFKLLQD